MNILNHLHTIIIFKYSKLHFFFCDGPTDPSKIGYAPNNPVLFHRM